MALTTYLFSMANSICKVCQKTGDEVEFYNSIATYCKEHWKQKTRINRRSKLEYYRAYDRDRGCRRTLEDTQKWRAANPEKYKAHNAVNNAVRDGKLKQQPCFMCNSDKAHAHHVDYSKPLDVIWLCAGCHQTQHAFENKVNEIQARVG
jgi:hypothetical protein